MSQSAAGTLPHNERYDWTTREPISSCHFTQ